MNEYFTDIVKSLESCRDVVNKQDIQVFYRGQFEDCMSQTLHTSRKGGEREPLLSGFSFLFTKGFLFFQVNPLFQESIFDRNGINPGNIVREHFCLIESSFPVRKWLYGNWNNYVIIREEVITGIHLRRNNFFHKKSIIHLVAVFQTNDKFTYDPFIEKKRPMSMKRAVPAQAA